MGHDLLGRTRRVSAFAQDNWHFNDKINISVEVRVDHNHTFLAEAP